MIFHTTFGHDLSSKHNISLYRKVRKIQGIRVQPMVAVGRGLNLVVRAECWHAGDPGLNPPMERPLHYLDVCTPSTVSILGIWI
jgi:hypothetical protein